MNEAGGLFYLTFSNEAHSPHIHNPAEFETHGLTDCRHTSDCDTGHFLGRRVAYTVVSSSECVYDDSPSVLSSKLLLSHYLLGLLICMYTDGLMKLQQLLTPTSFQWSSSLFFLNMLTEVDEMTLLGSLFRVSTTLWLKKFWRRPTCRVDRGLDSFKLWPLRWLNSESVKNCSLLTFSLSVSKTQYREYFNQVTSKSSVFQWK